ncbi:Protein of unknown function [Cotesia congregata]|uniref:EB domain-containing protein n=1 Tax=Cotesia congregata TaxID=51543 RepID=A0A8J2HEI0_COTCN|nr:Protein of unknown function [Cotesia congregata]
MLDIDSPRLVKKIRSIDPIFVKGINFSDYEFLFTEQELPDKGEDGSSGSTYNIKFSALLGGSCQSSDDCLSTPFSNCTNGTCSCKDNYILHDGVCYDCVTTSYHCKEGTCQEAIYFVVNDQQQKQKLLSLKPGATSYWTPVGENGTKLEDSVVIRKDANGSLRYIQWVIGFNKIIVNKNVYCMTLMALREPRL